MSTNKTTLDIPLTLRVAKEQQEAIRRAAKAEGKTPSVWIRDVLRAGLAAAEVARGAGLHTDEWVRLAVRSAKEVE